MLRDDSQTTQELRTYLAQVPSDRLSTYVDQCLNHSFSKSGFVLQDLVNELGRRLDFDVENGLYQGRSGRLGADGIWSSSDGKRLIIEVKTTDAYRISLDTLAGYRDMYRARTMGQTGLPSSLSLAATTPANLRLKSEDQGTLGT